MTWKRTDPPKTILATPTLVKEFFEMAAVPRERQLRERRLMVYQRILKAGEFRPVVWASAYCVETATTYRVNGQHTSTLLHRQTPLPQFFVTVERYECPTLHDLGNLYNTFDSGIASRTTADINLSFAGTVAELREVAPKIINLTVGAAAFHEWDEAELRKTSQAERAELLLDNIQFCKWLEAFAAEKAGTARKVLVRGPVVNAMLGTYRNKPRVSDEFWRLVRDETEAQGSATRLLAKYLTVAVLTGGGTERTRGGGGKSVANAREMYVKCVRAWNAWRENVPTVLRYSPTDPLPEVSN